MQQQQEKIRRLTVQRSGWDGIGPLSSGGYKQASCSCSEGPALPFTPGFVSGKLPAQVPFQHIRCRQDRQVRLPLSPVHNSTLLVHALHLPCRADSHILLLGIQWVVAWETVTLEDHGLRS